MIPKVSICIPTFNRKNYLKQSLDSVFAQTYKDYEVIIVDDGSTDGTEDMIKKTGYKVNYHWQQNAGDAAARNKLIELAHGQFITFLDSDDLLIPDAVERMVKTEEAENGEVIVYGSYLRIDQNGNIYGASKRNLYSGHITKYLFQNMLVHSCGSMFPRKAFKDIGGFDTSLPVCSDYDLWLRLSLKYRFIALSEPTFKRRRHPGNLSTVSLRNQLVQMDVLERFYYEKGGSAAVPQKIAARRLSKECNRIGKCAINQKDYATAKKFLRKSFRLHPNIKSIIRWAKAVSKEKYEHFSNSQ